MDRYSLQSFLYVDGFRVLTGLSFAGCGLPGRASVDDNSFDCIWLYVVMFNKPLL